HASINKPIGWSPPAAPSRSPPTVQQTIDVVRLEHTSSAPVAAQRDAVPASHVIQIDAAAIAASARHQDFDAASAARVTHEHRAATEVDALDDAAHGVIAVSVAVAIAAVVAI